MRRSVASPVALGLLLALIASTPAEASGRFRSRRACPPPCPVPCPPACWQPTTPAAPHAEPKIVTSLGVPGTIKVCMVCDGGVWRAATASELGNCLLQDVYWLDKPCQRANPEAVRSHAHGQTCEPWCRLYCDHATGWRFPCNWCEWQQSYCLPISHLGRQCWYPDPKATHPAP